MIDEIERVLIDERTIQNRVRELGEAISRDYAGKRLLLVSVLKGSCVFMADLIRSVTIPCSIDFMYVSSYGAGTNTTGTVKILKDLDVDIDGVHLLLVEDILDSGVTLTHLIDILKTKNPASLRLCTLLNKPSRRQVPVPLDYEGFVIPDEFVVGYGLDYNEKYRNLPYIGILKPSVYSL